jgi:V/A-type H+-transporting ATPase subunit I
MIAPMRKVLVAGRTLEKRDVLEAVRRAGVVHVEPVAPRELPALPAVREELALADRALSILETATLPPDRCAPEHTPPVLIERILAIAGSLEACRGSRQALLEERDRVAPWGRLGLEDLRALQAAGLHVELLASPVGPDPEVRAEARQLAGRGDGEQFWVVVSRRAIAVEAPARRVPLPARDVEAVDRALAALDKEEARLTGELASFASCRRDLAGYRLRLRDQARFLEVEAGLHDAGEVFVLRGWVPAQEAGSLSAALAGGKAPSALQITEPAEDDQPPTHFQNAAWCQPIETLYRLLGVFPGYREKDISSVFLPALTIFAGMLIAAAGYAICALLVIAAAYRPLVARGTPRAVLHLALILCGGVLAVGALTNTWFGESLIRLTPFEASAEQSQGLLQRLCFLLGAVHLSIARVLRVWGRPIRLSALAEAGWLLFIWAMLALVNTLVLGAPPPRWMVPVFQLSLGLVLAFTAPSRNPLTTVGRGLAAIALNAISFLSDIISYIRLWAVGLAGGILAASFNEIAGSLPLAAASLVLVPAHMLNLALGLVAVLAHGIRLNLLEFSNQVGMEWSGREYQPFHGQA